MEYFQYIVIQQVGGRIGVLKAFSSEKDADNYVKNMMDEGLLVYVLDLTKE